MAAASTFSCPDHIRADHIVHDAAKEWVAVDAKGKDSPLVNATIFDGDPKQGHSIAPAAIETGNGYYVDYTVGKSANGTGIRCEYFGTAATFVRVIHEPLTCKFVKTSRPIQSATFDCHRG